MFARNSQIPNNEVCNILNKKSRRQRKKDKKNKRKSIKGKGTTRNSTEAFVPTATMSSWAENFASAATWQLKHQIAYWKSKATALQYENKVLHDIIRNNYVNGDNNQQSDDEETHDITETCDVHEVFEGEEDNEGIEVSEEFIQFLMKNAKYKEEAKRERERFKKSQKTQDPSTKLEAMPTKSREDPEAILRDLYGENWQRIAALEASLGSQFMSNCDLDQPEYWPNIPFNFNF